MPRPSLPNRLSIHRLLSSSHNTPTKSEQNTAGITQSPIRGKDGGRGDSPELVLHTKVLRGKNLAAKDKNGTSDPYLVLNLGDERQATSVIYKSLDPEWNQTFDLPLTGDESLLLEAVCWDKDRFGKDYLGEFDIALEEVFKNGHVQQEPHWYRLESRRSKKKDATVSGEVLLQFSLADPSGSLSEEEIMHRFNAVVGHEAGQGGDIERTTTSEDEDEVGTVPTSSTNENKHVERTEKLKRRETLTRLKNKTKLRAYQFTGQSRVAGVLFVEISRITDLPPEKNLTRTSFDMDPFVVTSLGKKTYRTHVIRHNLNPIFDERLVFQVQKHEVNYSLNFAVIDRDKLSGNDLVGTVDVPIETIKASQPEADPETGLYKCQELPDFASTVENKDNKRSRFRLSMSRSSSATRLGSRSRNSSCQNLPKLNSVEPTTSTPTSKRPSLTREDSSPETDEADNEDEKTSRSNSNTPQRQNSIARSHGSRAPSIHLQSESPDDPDLKSYTLPLKLKNHERWEDKHAPMLYIRAKYLPYQALRQQFWRAMLRQYDADDSGLVSKVELTTMLDTLGSTLRDATIDSYFQRFSDDGNAELLTMDQAVMCLEDQLRSSDPTDRHHHRLRDHLRNNIHDGQSLLATSIHSNSSSTPGSKRTSRDVTPINNDSHSTFIPTIDVPDNTKFGGEEGLGLATNELAEDEKGEEHVVEIQECPICHQPRLDKNNTESDIITHIATCASQDWRAVNNIVMSGFVTSSQARRKWYSKVITKIGYGGYKLGANSANILVQDRLTGQINEERMSVYVRLGIRLLYKGLKSREMEKKRIRKLLRSLSLKQGRKFDDPASALQIPGFVNFHQLDMSEVLLPLTDFKSFNEFFYRKLKPDARPCSAPDRPEIITSPADCRSVVFHKLETAQQVWVKGREFSIERLLGNAYPEDVKRYQGGALGVFRLAPQDYHRFHIPVDGIMGEPKLIDGEYYTVNPMAIRSTLDVYGENVRVLVPIDSVKHGRVMVVCVGAMMVGSTVITRKTGEHVRRAEELGYFKFGGSTLLLLFEPGVMRFDPDLVENSIGALETLIRVGMSVGHCPEEAPYLPDMRKDNATLAEKQDAKRRIEGSLAPAASPIVEADEEH